MAANDNLPPLLKVDFASGQIDVVDTLALTKNVATNGRLFCSLLAAIDLAGFLGLHGAAWLLAAFVAALPVAGAVFVDQIGGLKPRVLAARFTYAIAAIAAIGTLLLILKV